MATSRYSRDTAIRGSTIKKSASAFRIIRRAVGARRVPFHTQTLRGWQRLDVLAGQYYGDGRYWWIIAAASDIGWGLQVPPGTQLIIPNLQLTLQLVS